MTKTTTAQAPAAEAPSEAQNSLAWPPPNAESFSFDDYLEGNSTFPEFPHTVYLDQATGVQLQEVIDKYEELAAETEKMRESQQALRYPGAALVSEESEEVAVKILAAEKRLGELEGQMNELSEKIKKSGMTLTFQLSTVDHLTQVVRAAEKTFHKQHGRGDNDDVNHMALRSKYILLGQLEAFCIRITAANGTDIPRPDRAGYEKLLERLIPSESVRLLSRLNEGLDSSTKWADRVDAGFPGGGPVMQS